MVNGPLAGRSPRQVAMYVISRLRKKCVSSQMVLIARPTLPQRLAGADRVNRQPAATVGRRKAAAERRQGDGAASAGSFLLFLLNARRFVPTFISFTFTALRFTNSNTMAAYNAPNRPTTLVCTVFDPLPLPTMDLISFSLRLVLFYAYLWYLLITLSWNVATWVPRLVLKQVRLVFGGIALRRRGHVWDLSRLDRYL